MRPVLRTIAGGAVGTTHAIGERTTVGRASFADVQLVDASVSRIHALIELEDDGRHAIVDLSSHAGITVDGDTVRRAVLEPGSVVEICGFRLRYEFNSGQRPLVASPKVTSGIVARPTLHTRVADDKTRAAGDKARDDDDDAAESTSMEHRATGLWRATRKKTDWLKLLREIVELWDLREAGVVASPRLTDLTERFTAPADAHGHRVSMRHPCRTPALIGVTRGSEVVTTIGFLLEAGSDGATVCTEESLTVGRSCWLLVATGDGERSGIAFSSRVVWVRADAGTAGLAFVAGPVAGPKVLPSLHALTLPR